MLHIHQLPGRLRVRTASLKGNEQLASSALKVISQLKGVTSARINTITGSILIQYNATLTHSAPIIKELNRLKILSGILGFPKPLPTIQNSRPVLKSLSSNVVPKISSESQAGLNKKLISELCMTAGKIFLLTVLEQTASSAAKALVRRIL